MTKEEVMDYINQYLPEDIGVIGIEEMPERFHSRLNAKVKTYRYRIWNSQLPCVFERKYVYEMPLKLDITAMEETAQYLIGKHDFKAFTSNKKGKKSTIRTIQSIDIQKNGSEIVITYQGDGFLYHMVRILTGTIIEAGLHKRKPWSVKELLEADASRDMAGYLVPAKGLSLMEVRY
jgi:tRNA pseudouridine38-40 synthase